MTESQTPSCRALAGSLASFDCPSDHIIGNEGVPLLLPEETELESNNVSYNHSVSSLSMLFLYQVSEQGETMSAYSQASTKSR